MKQLDHTAIAVADLDEALPRFQRLYGVMATERVAVPEQGVEVAFLPFGGSQLELIQPLENDSGVARFLAQRGEALHHIAFAVEDIWAELERLRQEGVELLDQKPRQGVHGSVAFVHPRGTGGVLVELVQRS